MRREVTRNKTLINIGLMVFSCYSVDLTCLPHTLHMNTSHTDESSQDSMAWSAQSSQEECPEDFLTPNRTDYSHCHHLLPLGVAINTSKPRQYK